MNVQISVKVDLLKSLQVQAVKGKKKLKSLLATYIGSFSYA